MSMLADRRRKQKWSLNPNGKEWSQDSNKFGQKLLEKMGWQHGKGLGAKEDGVTEHIKVSHKINSRGMGYKETNDQWTEHESNFTALLAALSGDKSKDESQKIQLKSLEKKSQNSRARVHYHKFTRGKDLSRYSEKDLANIFGKKSLKSEPKKDDGHNAEKASDSEKESSFYFSGGSMKDYFKKKMPNFGKMNDFIVGNNGVLKKAEDSESESDMKPSFGFGFKSEETDTSSVTSNKTSFISYIQEDYTPSKRKAEEENPQEVFSPTKKHKKDKKQKKKENLGLSNPAFEPLATPNEILQKHILDPIEESSIEYINQNMDTTVTYQSEENSDNSRKFNEKEKENNISYVSIRKKRKKNTVVEDNSIEIEDQHIQDNHKKSHKKKKKQTDICDETNPDSKRKNKEESLYDNPSFQIQNISMEETLTISENPYEVKLSSKMLNKKKKVNKKNLDDADNINRISKMNKSKIESIETDAADFSFGANITESCSLRENLYEVDDKKIAAEKSNNNIIEYSSNSTTTSEGHSIEVKPKKDKKKKSKAPAVENPCFDDSMDISTNTDKSITISSINENNPYEVKTKKEKKKKCKALAVENPCFDESSGSIIEENPEENPYEVKLKKEKRKKSKAFENPGFNDSIESSNTTTESPLGVEPKKTKKSKRKAVPDPQEEDTINEDRKTTETNYNDSIIQEDCDLILNVVSTPIIKADTTSGAGSVTRVNALRRRKSVRFSDVTQELIIPNNDDLREMYDSNNDVPRNLDSISKALDNFQAEMENDINEDKVKAVSLEDIMVGEVGNPHGENEKLPEGTKLKFKYANLNAKTPFYQMDKVGPKKSYKHLIKGDIVVQFKNTNLHEIEGYGVKNKTAA